MKEKEKFINTIIDSTESVGGYIEEAAILISNGPDELALVKEEMMTDMPSSLPSDGPSLMPSDGPSLSPVVSPTDQPTGKPTVSYCNNIFSTNTCMRGNTVI